MLMVLIQIVQILQVFKHNANADHLHLIADQYSMCTGQMQAMVLTGLTNWYIKNKTTVAVKRAPTKRL